jgi:hypothetical protein
MAVAIVLDFPGGTMDDYKQVVERMQLNGRMAPGGLFHTAGITSDPPGLRVVDVWEDRDRFMQFAEEQIRPHTQAVGLPEPAVRMIDVDEFKDGSGEAPAFVQVVTLPGLDREKFHATDKQILPDGKAPAGVTFHVNGPVEGGWMVIDSWTSKEARDRFAEERIKPAMGDAGLTGPPVFEDLDVQATLLDRATAPA